MSKSKKTTAKTAAPATQSPEDRRHDELTKTGAAALSSIRDMVAALECDYERLETLRESRREFIDADDSIGEEIAIATWTMENPNEAEELAELESAAGECESEDDARERIQEDPLSLQFRSGWCGGKSEMVAEEFELLLATGGPAVRIIGEIVDEQAHHPRLQVQDWGTPWTDYYEPSIGETLEKYCAVFDLADK